MKKQTMKLLALMGLGLMACSPRTTKPHHGAVYQGQSTKVPYELATGYFALSDTVPRLIKSQDEMDRYLGMAATMHTTPTQIDWSKSYLLTIVAPETKRDLELSIASLFIQGDCLYAEYDERLKGFDRSFTVRPLLVLVIPREYEVSRLEVRSMPKVGIAYED